MKKILTVSLVAVMAVSAAHAKIASVEYVDPKFQSINTTIGTWGTNQQAIGQDVATAVVNLKTSVDSMNGDNGTVANALAEAKTYAEEQASAAQAAAEATAAADATAKANAAKSGAEATAAADATSKANAAESNAKGFTTAEIQKLDVAQVGAEGSFIELVSEADGKVSATPKEFAKTVAENGTVAPTAGAVFTFVGNAVDALGENMNTQGAAVDKLTEDLAKEAQTARAAEQANAAAAAAAKTAADNEATRAKAAEADLQGEIDAINHETTGILALAKADATTKADAAQAAAEATAAADATAKANAAKSGAEATAKGYTDAEIQKLNLDQVGAEGSFIELVSESNGKVSASAKGFATEVAAGGKIAPTAGAVHTAVATAKSEAISTAASDATNKANTAKSEAISEADTAAKAMIQLTKAMTDCAQKQCALTISKGNILWEEVVNQ